MQLIASEDVAPIPLRALAAFLDAVILTVLVLTVGAFALSAGVGLGATAPVMIVVAAAYHIGFVAATGATRGKPAACLHIVSRDGLRPRPDAAVLRFLVYFVLGIPFPFGTIANVASMLADEERRTLADRVAGTIVRVRPSD